MSFAPLCRTLLVALTALALAPAVAPAAQDLRSPDTRDAAAQSHAARDHRWNDLDAALAAPGVQDLRSPDTRDIANRYNPSPTAPQRTSASAPDGGIALLPFVLALAGALIVGLVGGNTFHGFRTHRRRRARMAT